MSYAYHGNWCGPGWSDGRYTESVKGFAPAIDEFDETCRQHDFSLAGGTKDIGADLRFIRANAGKGLKRTVASVAVLSRAIADVMVGSPTVNKKHNPSKAVTMPKTKNTPRVRKTAAASKPVVQTAAPVSIATTTRGTAAKMVTKPNGMVEVSNKTFIGPVSNFINFTAAGYACNPGITSTFPWLSKVARRYEQYRFRKLRYVFRSVTSASTSGIIMLSFDFDAADSLPSSKSVQTQSVPNTETNVWMNNTLTVPTDNVWRFVRPGPLATNLDIKTYDFGTMVQSSCYGNGAIGGELYVEYVVELRMPTDGPEIGGVGTFDAAMNIPFGSSNTTYVGPAYPFVRLTDNSITTQIGGEYLITFRTDGTGLTGAFPVPVITSNNVLSVITLVTSSTTISATRAMVSYRARLDTGDILYAATCGAGTSASKVVVYVTSCDYTSFA